MTAWVKRLRKKVGYESDTPLCEGCIHFMKARIVVISNSRTTWQPARCKLHSFIVKPRGSCDTWKCAKTGDIIDTSTEAITK